MKPSSRPLYRIRQFLLAIQPPAQPVQTADLSPHLSPAQMALFRRLQRSEQWHAWRVLQTLQAGGHTQPDLLSAALLHDIGKVLFPLRVWERALIVLVKRMAPKLAQRWGQESPQGLNRAFAVASQHANWGADLAHKAGASELTVDLIRRHEERTIGNPQDTSAQLLHHLQEADDSN